MTLLPNRALALIIVALLFLWMAMLLIGGPGSAGDSVVLHAFNSPALLPAARVVTRLGDWSILLPLTLAATALLAWRRNVRSAALLLVITLSGRFLVELQKYEFNRARPDAHGHVVATHNMAFPSGHAAYSMMFWLGLALLAFEGEARRRAALFAVLLAFAVGLTRPVLGVHWPSDVIGGWSFGAAWALLLTWLVEFRERGRPSAIVAGKESDMNDRDRPDDSELIESMEDAPSQAGSSGGNIQRDVAAQAELDDEIGDGGITRVTGEDKPADGDEPTLPNRD
jgi:membrane-associated phospholipid phosphatase